MKLIFAIVHNEDGHKVTNALNKNSFGVTKLCSTGGFLRAGNTTLLVGVEDDQVDKVIELIEKESKSRKEVVSASMAPSTTMMGMFMTNPIEVTVGGATIFVVNVERMERV
jgi:uncharacterized protein YaaQ